MNEGARLAKFQVRGELTEEGTDVTFDASKDFKVEYTKMKLSTENQISKYFKPGLPFVDQVCGTQLLLAVFAYPRCVLVLGA